MGLFAWIVFGLLAGAAAQLILPGDDPGGAGIRGWIITLVIGIAGAIVGGFIGAIAGFGGVTGFNFGSFLIAVLGAIIVLLIWRWLGGRSGGSSVGVAR